MNTRTQIFRECELSFIYHILLYPRKLQTYCTLKLVHVFLNTLHMTYCFFCWISQMAILVCMEKFLSPVNNYTESLTLL